MVTPIYCPDQPREKGKQLKSSGGYLVVYIIEVCLYLCTAVLCIFSKDSSPGG